MTLEGLVLVRGDEGKDAVIGGVSRAVADSEKKRCEVWKCLILNDKQPVNFPGFFQVFTENDLSQMTPIAWFLWGFQLIVPVTYMTKKFYPWFATTIITFYRKRACPKTRSRKNGFCRRKMNWLAQGVGRANMKIVPYEYLSFEIWSCNMIAYQNKM